MYHFQLICIEPIGTESVVAGRFIGINLTIMNIITHEQPNQQKYTDDQNHQRKGPRADAASRGLPGAGPSFSITQTTYVVWVHGIDGTPWSKRLHTLWCRHFQVNLSQVIWSVFTWGYLTKFAGRYQKLVKISGADGSVDVPTKQENYLEGRGWQ